MSHAERKARIYAKLEKERAMDKTLIEQLSDAIVRLAEIQVRSERLKKVADEATDAYRATGTETMKARAEIEAIVDKMTHNARQ